MAHHKDAEKRQRQAEKARARNRHYTSTMRSAIKKLREAVESGDRAAADAQLSVATSVIQHVAQKGVIHRNQAARRVSRLAALVKTTTPKVVTGRSGGRRG